MKQINLQCPLNKLGYGVVSYNLANALLEEGVDLRVNPIGQTDYDILSDKLKESINKNVLDHKPDAPLIKIYHQFGFFERIGRGFYYGFPIFELDNFTEIELASLNVPDELIVPSKWAANILSKHINKKIHIIPFGVDTNIFKPVEKNNNTSYKFFNIGKLEKRKGHDFLPKVFSRAFEFTDDVELHFLCSNIFLSTEEHEQYKKEAKATKLGNKIFFHNYLKSSVDIANFINNMDCGVFPSRAEGWNLELLESMACGKPVITTNYSAHTEYCTKENSYLIDIKNMEDAEDGKWFYKQGKWAEIGYEEEEQLIEYMRLCSNNRPYNTNGIITARESTWNKSALKIMNLILT